jgi:hypothetical protein
MALLVREIEWFGELLLITGVISLDLLVGTVRCDDPDDLGAVQCFIGGFALVPVCTLHSLSEVASEKVHSWDLGTFIEWQQQCFMDIFAAFFKFVEEDNASLAFVGAEEIVH